jgi:endoglucanase
MSAVMRAPRLLARACLASFLVLIAAPASAASPDNPACAAVKTFPNPEMLKSMRRGVNLPGWDSADEGERPTTAQLQALRDRGFVHIRLPLDEKQLSGAASDAYLDQMFEEIILLLSLDYSVSLDLHAGGTIGAMFRDNPEAAERHLGNVWNKIAMRVRTLDPAKVAVELLNEPDMPGELWWPVAGRLSAEIRDILPATTIVVGPAGPQRHEALAGLKPLDDPNVVYAIHYYDPFVFTHQGADWGGPDDPLSKLGGLPYPAKLADPIMQERLSALTAAGHDEAAETLRRALQEPWDETAMTAAFDMMSGWSERHSRPVIVNEFGVLSYRAPRESRLDWLAAVRGSAEERCIGWTHWDFQDGFGLIDPATGMPDPEILDALVPEPR